MIDPSDRTLSTRARIGARAKLVLAAIDWINLNGKRVLWMEAPDHHAVWVRDVRKRVAEQLAAMPPPRIDRGTVASRFQRALEVLYDHDLVVWDDQICWLTPKGVRELRR
jgi:hypothetical protein